MTKIEPLPLALLGFAALVVVAGITMITSRGSSSAEVTSSRQAIRALFVVDTAPDGKGGRTCIGIRYVGKESGGVELGKHANTYFRPMVEAAVAAGQTLEQATTVILEDLFPQCPWPAEEGAFALLEGLVTQMIRPMFGELEASMLEPWEREVGAESALTEHGEDITPTPPGTIQFSGHPEAHCPPEQPDKASFFEGADPEPAFCIPDPFVVPEYRPREEHAPWPTLPASSTWPVQTKHGLRLVTSYFTEDGKLRGRWGRQFGAGREDDADRHAGVDLAGEEGDIVVAPQAGTIVAILPFYHGTWAVYLRTADDNIINLGEIRKLSWREFGIKPGMQVEEGQPVARIGLMRKSTMLHVEIYDGTGVSDEDLVKAIRSGYFQWPAEKEPPAGLLDPSPYLLQAATRTYRREKTGKVS